MRRYSFPAFLSLFLLLGILGFCSLTSCTSGEAEEDTSESTSSFAERELNMTVFGTTPDGQEATLYTLTNKNGMAVSISNYGGIITSIVTPDKNGEMGDVVLGFDSVKDYIPNLSYIGAAIGRYANRIAGARFILAGEEGYPGTLTTTITYTVAADNSLRLDYSATTDEEPPVNLTNYSCFNLPAGKAKDIYKHVVQINAGSYTPVNERQIPTGEVASVKGTLLDLTALTPLDRYIHHIPGGVLDHNYVRRGGKEDTALAAVIYEPESGRVLEVYTTQPGIQLYTGNFLDGSLTGRNGQRYTRHYALYLETQHFPVAPNQQGFPNPILQPGETYTETTIYKFSVRNDTPEPYNGVEDEQTGQVPI